MTYWIDGYNLIFSLIDSKESLQATRQKVIGYLQKKFIAKNISGMLIFDGAHRRDEERGLLYKSPLVIAYAPKGQSADEYIVEKIQTSENPKLITVVTNDKGLQMHTKSHGAKVMKNEAFIDWLKKKKGLKKTKEPKETPQNMDRLEKIFEERLKKDLEGF